MTTRMLNAFAKCGVLAAILVSCVAEQCTAEEIDRALQLDRYMRAASRSLAQVQSNALSEIKSDDRRNLAMTYYLRAGDSIESRWNWTRKRIETYERSTEYKDALAAIEAVAKQFAVENPGYRLHVHTEVRSLEEQLDRWAAVSSVGRAASELRTAALKQIATAKLSELPDENSTARFRKFLIEWRASYPPTLAAPGLSLHGRGRAYDFQIYDATDRPVAVTDAATVREVWDKRGWTEKLARAVRLAGAKFSGPLQAPREPWHYEYVAAENKSDE